MISHVWSVLCESVIVDKVSNQLSILQVLEKFEIVLGEPFDPNKVFPIAMTIASLWDRTEDGDSGRMRISFKNPDGATRKTEEFELDFRGQRRLRTIIKSAGLALRENGIYHFVVEWKTADGDWQFCTSVPLEIVINRAGQGQLTTPPATPAVNQ